MLSPDPIVARIIAVLVAAPGKPTGVTTAKILDHDQLTVDPDDCPVVGVYLVVDDPKEGGTMDGEHLRQARIRVEIRAKGPMLTATKPIREWVLLAILDDPQLNNETTFDLEYQGFQPFGMPSDQHLAGADLDFLATYLFAKE